MGPIIDAIWQLPWYEALIVAVVDDIMFLIKVWPLWVLIVVGLVLRYLYVQWDCKWGIKRRSKKRRAKAQESTNKWEDHGTYYKRPGKGESGKRPR